MPDRDEVPLSLAWVSLFAESANRALGGDVVDVRVVGRADPLQWVVVLTAAYPWTAASAAAVRMVLRDWAQANDAEYVRSERDGRSFSALVLVRGLGPEKRINPYEENSDGERRRSRSLDRSRR